MEYLATQVSIPSFHQLSQWVCITSEQHVNHNR